MSYYKLIGLDKEPFSTSPDPDFFYLSKEHDLALTNLLIELHMRRGLSVILGDVGTGKTTLSRKLVQCLRERGDFILHMVLDPYYRSERLFLTSIARNFDIRLPQYGGPEVINEANGLELKEAIQRFLYESSIVHNKTVVLLIDEAQKLTPSSLEMLRVILNYETNEYKLLQVVLLGQLELYSKITAMPNFYDRISFKYTLNPLGVEETRDLVEYRMRRAGYNGKPGFFTMNAIELIHQKTRGYPRKISMYCHRALKHAVMRNRWSVDEESVHEIMDEEVRSGWPTTILH